MPVTVNEYAKITDVNGLEHEGKVVATNLVAVEDGENTYYGAALRVTKVRVKVVCDNEKCENSQVGPDFVTHPKTIEFDETGEAARTVKEISDIVIVSDYTGQKLTFCTPQCYSAAVRRTDREKIAISPDKAPREVFYPKSQESE